MSDLYCKDARGNFVPISIDDIIVQEWENKLVVIRVGTDECPASEDEVYIVHNAFESSEVLSELNNTSFLLVPYNLEFEVLGSLKELKNKNISIQVTAKDDLSKLENLQKKAKEGLRDKVNKVVIMPTPLTVEEYKEVMDIKKRCDIRRQRRGN